jgi:glyoxalase family protein
LGIRVQTDAALKGIASGTTWQNGPVPLGFVITGLRPIHIRIVQFDYLKEVLEKVMLMREIATEGSLHLFEVDEGGKCASNCGA